MMPMELGIMDTITQNVANNKLKKIMLNRNATAIILGSILISSTVSANELRVTANIDSNLVYQDINNSSIADNQIDEVTTFEVIPTVNAEYRTRTFQGRWSGKYSYLDRDFDDVNRKDNFGEYLYSASWSPLDSLVTFSANGALNYQNVSTNGAFLNDFLLNSDELAKTRSNRYGATLRLPNTPWFRAEGSLSYADTASEQSELQQGVNLDNDSISSQGTIRNADDAERFFWEISGSYQTTDRSEGNQGDFVTRSGQATIDWLLLERIALNLTARHEANQISDTNNVFSEGREFNSYGVGVTYRQSQNRFITITFNTSDSEFDESDSESFIGASLNWAFSPRTTLVAEYGKRFYGDAGSVSFTHNRKKLRSQLSYTEEVTSFSRLIADPENLGVFVCADGVLELSACFQPNSLNYALQAGEEFVQFSTLNTDINDQVILRKSLNGQLGYQGKRINLSVSGQYGFNESVEIDRTQRTYNIGLQGSYTLGRYTKIDGRLSYAEVSQRSATLENGENETITGSLQISREIGRSLSTNLEFRYTDREGNLGVGDLTDRRISLGLTYRYE